MNSLLPAGAGPPISIGVPAERHVRYAKVNKDVVIKPGLADDQLVYERQECTRLSSLNNSMIVSGADGDGFTDAKLRQGLGRRGLIFSWVLDCARGNDQ